VVCAGRKTSWSGGCSWAGSGFSIPAPRAHAVGYLVGGSWPSRSATRLGSHYILTSETATPGPAPVPSDALQSALAQKSPWKPCHISYAPRFGASARTRASWISHSVRHANIPLTLILFDGIPLVLICNFCTLLRVLWTALDGLAGLRISEDHRPCAASKDNHHAIDGERVDGEGASGCHLAPLTSGSPLGRIGTHLKIIR